MDFLGSVRPCVSHENRTFRRQRGSGGDRHYFDLIIGAFSQVDDGRVESVVHNPVDGAGTAGRHSRSLVILPPRPHFAG